MNISRRRSGCRSSRCRLCVCSCAGVEDGCIPDVTEVDIRTQYLVENPEHGEEYAELKANAPCRLGIGKAGARYKTLTPASVPCCTLGSAGRGVQ